MVLSESHVSNHFLLGKRIALKHFNRSLKESISRICSSIGSRISKTRTIQLIAKSHNAFATEQDAIIRLHETSRKLGTKEGMRKIKFLKDALGTFTFIFDEIDKMKRSAQNRGDSINPLIYRIPT